MSQWLRLFAWLSVVGLAVASWTPGEYMIRTDARGSLEHIAAYLISTLLFVFAFPRSMHEAFLMLRRDASAGVDQVTYRDYEKQAEQKIQQLHERLKNKTYRA